MDKNLDKFLRELLKTWVVRSAVNWRDPSFSVKKPT